MEYGRYSVGMDEVGRGPLAGPVTVCGVLWIGDVSERRVLEGVRDSKQLSEKRREEWFERAVGLRGGVLEYAVCSVSAGVIDAEGIAGALARAAGGVLEELGELGEISQVYADYGLPAGESYPVVHLVKGDERHPLIALASVIAKVTRDREMRSLAEMCPHYGFERNKGYGTKEHRDALMVHGASSTHRMSFLGNILSAS